MPSKSPAQILLEKADKKANSSGGWFTSSTTKYEEAGDLYQQAANAFKLEKLFKDGGDAFSREAECRERCEERNEAANAWWNAAKSYKLGYPELAVQALTQTILHLTHTGRFRQAADRETDIGEIYRDEIVDLRRACESFERAADWYAQEGATATANKWYKVAAELHADLDEYPQAIARFEQVATHSLSSALTKYGVKEFWLKAGLCSLAMKDTVTAKRNLARYQQQDPSFTSTRECKLLEVLVNAMIAGDEEMFMGAVSEYDQVTPLDKWMTPTLLKIKKSMQGDFGLT